ncbi:MAG: tRNA 2-selenouridine(34) synthase MnmH [Saprospiraceae bacterium]
MLRPLTIEEWIKEGNVPIIDVRSPAEHKHGHIPDAHTLPLFNDEERAKIGTLYKQVGKSEAILSGLDIVGPKMSAIIKQANELATNPKDAGHKTVRVHCWRGGMRSNSVAWLLNTAGFEKVFTLIGGYKAYRNWVLKTFEITYPLLILGGKTGSAKTEILNELANRKEPVIDLERLAHHKGSAFGWIGEQPQPSQEQFENNLAQDLYRLDPSDIWLEDESERIGLVRIPHPLFEQIRKAPVYFIDIPKQVRIQHLVKTYSHFGDEKLELSILRISKRLGGLNTKLALEALTKKEYDRVADITLNYYDKYYEGGVARRLPSSVIRITSDTIDPVSNADLILHHKSKSIHGIHKTHSV